MTKIFKVVATLEGISLLILFFIAMPLKYVWGMPQYIYSTGMAHGVLFIGYVFLALLIKEQQQWSVKETLIVLVASVVPLGTFYIEKKYVK